MLEVDMEFQRGILFIRLKGILDSTTDVKLQNALNVAIHQIGIKYLLLNCEKLYEIEKDSIDMIFKRVAELLKMEGKFLVCGFNDYVRLKVENSELNSVICKTENEQKAVQLIKI